MNRTSTISLSALAGAAVLATGVLIMNGGASAHPSADAVVMGHGLEVVDSQTADHWVSGAQHVVTYTVTGETEQPPQPSEIERKEGLTYRTVHARIDKVLWSRDGALKPPEGTWDFRTYGSAFNNNDGAGTAKFALEGRPRVEAGHTYIAALRWRDDPCSDDPAKGSWGNLGSGAILPFDGEVIGQGEYEGRVGTAVQNKALMTEESPDGALAGKLAGQRVESLMEALRQAKPIQGFGADLAEKCDPEDAAG